MSQRPRLSAIQLRRAVENAGGLWTAEELMRIGTMRFGDSRGDLPPTIYVDGVSYRCGYDMIEYAESLGRASSAEVMADAIALWSRQTASHYAQPLPGAPPMKGKPYRKAGIPHVAEPI